MDEFAKLTISIAVCWNMFRVHQAHLHKVVDRQKVNERVAGAAERIKVWGEM